MPKTKTLLKIALYGIVAACACAFWVWYELVRPMELPTAAAEVRIASGASARSIARDLRSAGVPVQAWEFVLTATALRATRSLRPGRYHIDHVTSVIGLVEKFRRGEVEREQLTVVEGCNFTDLRNAIAQSADLRHDTASWTEQQILLALSASEASAEGLFAPDTYFFDPGVSDLEVYRQAYQAQKERVERAWDARAADLPYAAPYEALIMASIIEKETGRPEERTQVAAVFVNRQRLHMPLQTDPTVIYGMGARYDGRLHKRDLLADTPYNTYTRAGLPPTPISLPGKAAIEAAVHPDPGKVLYFVARGDGSSEFSETLADHNRAVDRYQKTPARHPAN